ELEVIVVDVEAPEGVDAAAEALVALALAGDEEPIAEMVDDPDAAFAEVAPEPGNESSEESSGSVAVATDPAGEPEESPAP
ncbi:MAG: hypothetical protein OXC56_01370, partial [Chloroflexi bacterium]|nr:hypothetical protein [Chloroflexota bacterium]